MCDMPCKTIKICKTANVFLQLQCHPKHMIHTRIYIIFINMKYYRTYTDMSLTFMLILSVTSLSHTRTRIYLELIIKLKIKLTSKNNVF